MAKPKGIYCLEIGEWYDSLKHRTSVEPALQLLNGSPSKVPYIHRDIATEPELRYYLRKWWQSKHRNYPILYLAFHGEAGRILLKKENGLDSFMEIESLFELLEGRCHRRVIHFGSCSVLKLHGQKINSFLKQTGALAISGFTSNVDWIDSTVFDAIYLSELQENAFTRPGMKAVQNRLKRKAKQLWDDLGFHHKIRLH